MSQQKPVVDKQQMLRVMQIIAVALIIGPCVFAFVVAMLPLEAEQQSQLIALIAAAFGAATIVLRTVIPPIVAGSQRRQRITPLFQGASGGDIGGDPERQSARETAERSLYQVYQSKMIVEMALLEGAAFFNVIAYMIEEHWWSLVVAGALVVFMAGTFPTRGRVQAWVQDQLSLAELEA